MHTQMVQTALDSAPIAVPAEKAGLSIKLGSVTDKEDRLYINYKKRNKERREMTNT